MKKRKINRLVNKADKQFIKATGTRFKASRTAAKYGKKLSGLNTVYGSSGASENIIIKTEKPLPIPKIEIPLQNGKELKPIMIKPNMGRIIKPMAKLDRKSTRLNSSHVRTSRMPSSA